MTVTGNKRRHVETIGAANLPGAEPLVRPRNESLAWEELTQRQNQMEKELQEERQKRIRAENQLQEERQRRVEVESRLNMKDALEEKVAKVVNELQDERSKRMELDAKLEGIMTEMAGVKRNVGVLWENLAET